jgi:hypothetical protein
VRVTRTIATGVFLGWLCQSSAAVPPAIDRPSPPPCCADGQCFASPLTHGYYATRWRRWPLETMAQAGPGKPVPLPAPLREDVSPFEIPPAEQEDRKAPPPSVPAGDQTPAAVPSSVPRSPGAPIGPAPPQGTQPPAGGPPSRAPGFPPPQTAPLTPPAAPVTPPAAPVPPSGTGPLYRSVPPDSPLNRGGPMGDADPPPSLPFGPALVAPEQPTRGVSQQPAALPVQSPSVKPAYAPSTDPPPALPIALASYEE